MDKNHPRRVVSFVTGKYPVPIFGDEVIINCENARFVEQDQRSISNEDVARRVWKYYGPEGEERDGINSEESLETYVNRDEYADPGYKPLEGFWAFVSGTISLIEGAGHETDDPEMELDPSERRITGIAWPHITLDADLIEFEVDPYYVHHFTED